VDIVRRGECARVGTGHDGAACIGSVSAQCAGLAAEAGGVV